MKKVCYISYFIFILYSTAYAKDLITALSSLKIVHDEKYGDIQERSYVYLNDAAGLTGSAKINFNKVFENYIRTKKFDEILKKEGDGFRKERDEMLNKIIEAQRQHLPVDIEQLKKNVIAFDKQKRAEIAKQKRDCMEGILEDIQNEVAKYADKKHFRAVFNSRTPNLRENLDITGNILSSLNSEEIK